METTCKESCVTEQSHGFTSSKSMLIFCKLPSLLYGCIAANSGSQDFCGYQHAGPESQATLLGEQIWLIPNTFLSDTLGSLKACFIYF